MNIGRTLEQRLKFEHGLPIGESIVKLTRNGRSRLFQVSITSRGAVYLIPKPLSIETYGTLAVFIRYRVRGDTLKAETIGSVHAWYDRIFRVFDNAIVATVINIGDDGLIHS